MADGGLVTLETPRGMQWLRRKEGHFAYWVIAPHQTYIVTGTRTGIYKWMIKHSEYTVQAQQGDLFMQLRSHMEPLAQQLQKAYAGAAMGGTPISSITGPINAAASVANAFGAGASAAGELATGAAVLGAEVMQLAFDEAAGAAKGPGMIARGLDKLGLRDKYTLYFTAIGPHHGGVGIEGSTLRFQGGLAYGFEPLARMFMTLKC